MNLSERIKLINLQNGIKDKKAEQEDRSEERLLASVEALTTDLATDNDLTIDNDNTIPTIELGETNETYEALMPKPAITIDDVYLEVQHLKDTIEQQNEILAKINKHINATQKLLKKGSK